MDLYFVITNSDGDTHVDMFEHKELTHNLNNHYWGDEVEFFDEMPEDSDTNDWSGKVLIIKGNLACPKPKKVAITFDI